MGPRLRGASDLLPRRDTGRGRAGTLPGEFAFTNDDYRTLHPIRPRLHANAIRVDALPPARVLPRRCARNAAHPDRPLWLFQEVGPSCPRRAISGTRVHARLRARDPPCGGTPSMETPPRSAPGHASGATTRTSRHGSPAGSSAGWSRTRVRITERSRPDSTEFRGSNFSLAGGTPMWRPGSPARARRPPPRIGALRRRVTRCRSYLADARRHAPTHRRSAAATKGARRGRVFGRSARASGDAPRRIPRVGFLGYRQLPRLSLLPGLPDLDPGYAAFRTATARARTALPPRLEGHTTRLPLLIGEFGVRRGRGVAHPPGLGDPPRRRHRAGAGTSDLRLLETLAASGCAAGFLRPL